MSLLGSLFTTQMHEANNSIVSLVASNAPIAAGQAQIHEQEGRVDAAAKLVADYQPKVDMAVHHVAEVKASVDAHMKALANIAAAADAATDPTMKAAKEATFGKLEAETKALQAELASSQATVASVQGNLAHYKDVFNKAMGVLSTMKHDIEEAIQAQQDAKINLEEQARRKHDELVAAGIETGISGGSAALDAMRANTARLKAQAAASAMQADALANKHHVDDDVQAALAEASSGPAAPTGTLAERMAALRGQ